MSKKSKGNLRGVRWTPEEDKLLLKSRAQGLSYAKSAEAVNAQFKTDRTDLAVSNRLHGLGGSKVVAKKPAKKKKALSSKDEVQLQRALSMLPLAGYRMCQVSVPGFSVKMEVSGDKVTQLSFGRLVKAVTATVK